MTMSSMTAAGARSLGAALPVGVASLLSAVIVVLLNGAPLLAPILVVTAVILMAATTAMESRGLHIAIRLAVQVLVLAAAMYYLYNRGDVYAPQAAASVIGGVLVLNIASFAATTAANAGVHRLPSVIALVGSLFMVFAGFRLPNEGVLVVAIVAGIAAALLWWRPLPYSGAVFGSFAWALGFYAWLGNASGVAVAAPVVIAAVGVGWTLIERLATTSGRASLGDGSWWSRINSWTMPAAALRTSPLTITAATLASVVVAAAVWSLRLGDKAMLAGIALVMVGYIAWHLISKRSKLRRDDAS